MPETYNEEAIQQILKLAMSRQGKSVDLTRSQFREIATKLGISEENLVAAEQDWVWQCQDRDDRLAFDLYRHIQLRRSVVGCIAVNTFLLGINVVLNHTVSWSVFPTLAWGCILTLQAWQTYQNDGEDYDRAFRRWKLGQQIGESFKAITEQLNRTLSSSPDDNSHSSNHGISRNNDTSPV